ncbi:Flp pilus assembly protein TadG [Sedimentibacter acidaminivorans]|uniref:Flp pilus assembly protein TadG n=1 Tax=Sedimentibacter acidaminivorans TaxID=913099 RepID=A0ABS4GAV8_9FIRM|nr:TadE family protein [Sedimentibacter acidaminivorans]MBP1924812.1 Flp pilus assembly protein TadG [Sedimentibacter acidaminivorans]
MFIKKEDGQAMVEFALVLPILIFLIAGIIDFGWIFGNQILADNACREAARYNAIHYNIDKMTIVNATIKAEEIINNRAPTLKSNNVNVSKSNESITVYLESDIFVITPFLSAIVGDTFTLESTCIMKLEY